MSTRQKLTLIILIFVLSSINITAQVVTSVAPLKPGNKWVYYSVVVFRGEIKRYEVTDSVKVIDGISFYHVLGDGFSALLNNGFYTRYSEGMADSLYKYFKLNPQKGDSWEQNLALEGSILYSTIIDTFSAPVFNKSTLIFVVDRTDSGVVGSREFWTEEFGMLNGLYEQAEDYLLGCVIDGVVHGDTSTVSIDDEEQLPTKLVLYQNYPNPFNPSTTIKWELKHGSYVVLKVYNILGREIKTLVNGYYNPGLHEIKFNSDNLTSGVYIYRLVAGRFSESKKMLLTK